MILQRTELDLIGPDAYPAEEGSADIWSRNEKVAVLIYKNELKKFLEHLQEQLPDEFEVEAR